MRLLESGSSNIAWFKLADFVARGEKERALNVHKLLMYSVEEQAFAYQLEADILLSFDDDLALSKYHAAANLYKKQEKYQRAIDVYRHVLLQKEDVSIIEALLDVYHFLHIREQILATFFLLAKACVLKKDVGFLFGRLYRFSMSDDKKMYAELYGALIRAMLLHDAENKQIKIYLQQAIDLYQECDALEELYLLLEYIKQAHQSVYDAINWEK
jgi:lipopolysaccharide biosynthesis regulator YciM